MPTKLPKANWLMRYLLKRYTRNYNVAVIVHDYDLMHPEEAQQIERVVRRDATRRIAEMLFADELIQMEQVRRKDSIAVEFRATLTKVL